MFEKEVQDHYGNTFPSITEMLNYYHVTRDQYYGRKRLGLSLSECLEFKKTRLTYDFEGNIFYTLSEKCNYWNIPLARYQARIKAGFPEKCALLLPSLKRKHDRVLEKEHKKQDRRCVDMYGQEFSSLCKMCNYYKVPISLYKLRLKHNWNDFDALLTNPIDPNYENYKLAEEKGIPKETFLNEILNKTTVQDYLDSHPYVDLNQRFFRTLSELCKANNITANQYQSGLRRNLSLKEIIDERNPMRNRKGIRRYDKIMKEHSFSSMEEMCNYYNIDKQLVYSKLKNGVSLEDSIDPSFKYHSYYITKNGKKYPCDHLRHPFNNKKEMYEFYHIDPKTCRNRLASGWSLKRALTTPVKK